MKLSENPLVVQPLTLVKELTGGHKGVLFLLENSLPEKLVVKFQKENPVEALAGTAIVKRAQGPTPGVRTATLAEVEGVDRAVKQAAERFPQPCQAFDDAFKKLGKPNEFKYVLFMDFAEGQTLKKVREESPREFLRVLCDGQFQLELGRILAADVFSGNPDRMFAGKIEDARGIRGWYHEQNLFITADKKPVAIDNAFAPYVVGPMAPFGRYLGTMGVQVGSLALASQELAKQEAAALFDRFLESTIKDHPGIEEFIKSDIAPHREEFVATVSESARTTMTLLLRRGQGWKASLSEFGADKDLIAHFRIRKRILRLMAAGVDPKLSVQAAKDKDASKYYKLVLTTEYEMEDKAAEELLRGGIEAYKRHKAQFVDL